MRVLLVLTVKITDMIGDALFGPCKAEQRMLAIREHARQLRDYGSSF